VLSEFSVGIIGAQAESPMNEERLYKAIEFARVAGVTVRTLHHYDRIGLLKPGGYTSTGYRVHSPGNRRKV